MKKILNIISSPLGDNSYSNKLGNALLEKIKSVHPDAIVITRNLAELQVPHVQASHVAAYFTPQDLHTDEHKETTKLSIELIDELMAADILVINVPTYNLSVPSSLKAWIDQISRSGITFKYTEQGPVGFVTGKQVFLAISSGAVFSEGPAKAWDFVEPYLRTILAFIGMTDVTVFRVEGLATLGEVALENGLQSVGAFEMVA